MNSPLMRIIGPVSLLYMTKKIQCNLSIRITHNLAP
jgi:hypothetical protein